MNCYMFQHYLKIFRQLFSSWNCCTALDLKSIYFNTNTLSLFTLKCVCLRIKLSLLSSLFSSCDVHVRGPFICMFPIAGRMYLVRIKSQLLRINLFTYIQTSDIKSMFPAERSWVIPRKSTHGLPCYIRREYKEPKIRFEGCKRLNAKTPLIRLPWSTVAT
jgi:hypothetical protein